MLRTLPECSVDSVVCDPPYEIGFMGKAWDARGVAFDPETWRHALRVLKPGGHLLAFGGTRTYHRMVCAIEDAGFEVRDCIAWVYGSGFPKSLDVSKAIDKAGGDALAWRAFSDAYARAVGRSGLSHADIDRTLGVKSSSCYWARTDHRGGMPPRHHWNSVRALLGLSDEFERLYEEAEREVVGHREGGLRPGANQVYGEYSGDTRITAAATDAARRWQGWGTALKPAHEPIVVARKPLSERNVAANVLRWGTGAINVDGCRVDGAPRTTHADGNFRTRNGGQTMREGFALGAYPSAAGRWPANICHDGSDEVLAVFPAQAGAAAPVHLRNGDKFRNAYGAFAGDTDEEGSTFHGDSGSAARFFYCAKATKTDRGNGNTHPTVKPTDLMRWLVRLVTPPRGTVLDPFAGSGSTLKAAELEGFDAIGIELLAEHIEIARRRIGADCPLFAEVQA